MQNPNLLRTALLGLKRVVTTGLCGLLLAGYLCAPNPVAAQATVLLAPLPQLQFFDQSGRPLAFGCVFTYANNTTTPLATYTDYTGVTQNTNPVILSAGGSANIWIQAGVSYSFKVKGAGGTNCFSGPLQYTVNGIGGGVSTLTTVVPYSPTPTFQISAQNQLFQITLTGDASSQPLTAVGIIPPGLVTFQITQDASGGHSFSWPANVIGGCDIGSLANQVTLQHFIWTGTSATAVGPCVTGNGPAVTFGIGTAIAIESDCSIPAQSGFLRLCNVDLINWRNHANSADYGIGADTSDRGVFGFPAGNLFNGAIPDIFLGGTTASFPRLKRNSTAINVRLADDSADAPLTASTLGLSGPFTSTSATYAAGGPEVSTPSAPAAAQQRSYWKAGKGWCSLDSSSVEYCGIAGDGKAIEASSITLLGSPVSIAGSPTLTTVLTKAVTMPASGCPCRAFVSYNVNADTDSSTVMAVTINDGTNNFATGSMNTTGSTGQFSIGGASWSTGTYANGASVTFTMKASQNGGGTENIHVSNGVGVGQASWMNVAISPSN